MLLFSALLYIAFFDIEALVMPLFDTPFAKVNEILKIVILVILMTFPAIKNDNYSIRLTHKIFPYSGILDKIIFFIAMVLITWQMGKMLLIAAVVGLICLMVVRKWNIT